MRTKLNVGVSVGDDSFTSPYPMIWPPRPALLGSANHPTNDARNHPTNNAGFHPTNGAALHPTNNVNISLPSFISNEMMAEALRTTRAGLVLQGGATVRRPIILRSGTDAHALWRWERQARQEACLFELLSGLRYEHEALWHVPGLNRSGTVSGSAVKILAMTAPSDAVLEAQANLVLKRTPERGDRLAEILVQADQFWPFWTAVTNMEWTAVPFTFELLQLATSFATPVVMRLKHALACPRPADVSPLIQPVIPTPGHGSLPSGHATVAHMVAKLLQELLGSKDDVLNKQLDKLAARIADNRVVAGLHYPMDSAAGCLLGQTLADYFLSACTAKARPFGGAEFNLKLGGVSSDVTPLGKTEVDERLRSLPPVVARTANASVVPGKAEIRVGDAKLIQQMWAASNNELRALKYVAT